MKVNCNSVLDHVLTVMTTYCIQTEKTCKKLQSGGQEHDGNI